MTDAGYETETVELLSELGLTEYEARTFVALLQLGEGTAKDVSDVSDVPRTRVYDAVEQLHDRGLVDVQYGSPQKFWAVSRDTSVRKFQRRYEGNIEHLSDLLSELETVERGSHEQPGVWTVTGRESVEDRIREFLDEATAEVVCICTDERLTDDIVEKLIELNDAGVDLHLGGVSTNLRERVDADALDATVFHSPWKWSETAVSRLLMVDGETTLVSVKVDSSDAETAIWGTGEKNSLVVVLKAILSHRIPDDGDSDATE
ncbi:TrmB family transcriptional regulator [Haladaptatus sp. NG-WS-4]